jgi:hypothetical protein
MISYCKTRKFGALHILAQTPEWKHWRKLILAHFDKSMSSNLMENTFSAQLILAQRVLCAKAAKYNRAPNFLVLQYLANLSFYTFTKNKIICFISYHIILMFVKQ